MASWLYRVWAMKHRLLGLAVLLASVTLATSAARAQDVPVVAAAADLQFALTEVAGTFAKQTGREVKLAFGSSGNLCRQIQRGAPFQMFMSADEQFVFDLSAKELTRDGGTLYAIGRIVVLTPDGSPLATDSELAGLKKALAAGIVRKFAIANPEHAPYGRRAEEALRHASLWDAIKDKLVMGENVSQAAQFATSGSAQGGIIAYSLAIAPEVAKLGSFALIPESWHEPLLQRMTLIKGAGETAQAFYAFMQGPTARRIMRRYGFLLPGETS
jgi:molybdate transport system substrate-binding protein